MVANEDDYNILGVRQTHHNTPIARQHTSLQVERLDLDYLLDEADNIISILHVSEILLVFPTTTLALA